VTKIANYRLHGRLKFQGLDVSVENRKGSVRKWYDPHGKESGSTPMLNHYGYIRGTHGTDGDHVDVYVGPNPDAGMAYIIDQMKKPHDDKGKWDCFDEQKIMLGFDSAGDAQAAYMKQYNDPRFFGGLKEMPMTEFKAKVLSPKYHGEKIAVSANWIRDRITQGAVKRNIHLTTNEHSGIGRAAVDYTKAKATMPSRTPGLIKSDVIPEAEKQIGATRNKLREVINSTKTLSPGKRNNTRWDPRGNVSSMLSNPLVGAAATVTALRMNSALREDDLTQSRDATGSVSRGVERAAHGATVRVAKEPEQKSRYLLSTAGGAGAGVFATKALGGMLNAMSRTQLFTPRRSTLIRRGLLGAAAGATSELVHRDLLKKDKENREPLRRTIDHLQKSASTADRVDDAGIGLLAAPYAASVVGKAMEKHGPAKVRAAGVALQKGFGTGSNFDHSNARELGGLALVAPGISHRVAAGIDKLRGEKRAALEELARGVYSDFDFLTAEEQAVKLSGLLSLAGKAVGGAAGFAKGLTGMTKAKALALGGLAATGVGVGAAYKGVNALSRSAEEAGTGSLSPAPAQGLTRAF